MGNTDELSQNPEVEAKDAVEAAEQAGADFLDRQRMQAALIRMIGEVRNSEERLEFIKRLASVFAELASEDPDKIAGFAGLPPEGEQAQAMLKQVRDELESRIGKF